MGSISSVEDIASAVVYSNRSSPRSPGRLLHVDGGAHVGKMVTGESSRPASAEQRFKRTWHQAPRPPPEPFGTYVEAVQTGNLLFF